MRTDTSHPLVVAYLARLRESAALLPPEDAADLVADITEHLDAALGEIDPAAHDADDRVRSVLDRLGEPSTLVAAAASSSEGAARAVTPGRDPVPGARWAVVLLFAAGLFSVAWPIAGVAWVIGLVLFVRSAAWTGGEKTWGGLILGSAFPLGVVVWGIAGLAMFFTTAQEECVYVNGGEVCNGGSVSPMPSELVLGVLVVLVPLVVQAVTAVVLFRRARSR
ncbi:HAAS signaling domain-containing protein [Mobilicoccus caccae]|uniref:Integral membrane protein n=1 Tax=Mobilicoccus caccae TaxID=1859295 RepID=A0ABQ6ISP7_9MICO|nr:hypothetical protein [Mobilicoccus caccae]GMA39749.1 hypothetical protein GCM10025883_17940 [Mobilicoccus caccae]